jgi:hypothetical protein
MQMGLHEDFVFVLALKMKYPASLCMLLLKNKWIIWIFFPANEWDSLACTLRAQLSLKQKLTGSKPSSYQHFVCFLFHYLWS